MVDSFYLYMSILLNLFLFFGAISEVKARKSKELIFSQMMDERNLALKEAQELNSAFKDYMTSVEHMIKEHEKTVKELTTKTKEYEQRLIGLKKEAQALLDDFSPESKISTVLEQ